MRSKQLKFSRKISSIKKGGLGKFPRKRSQLTKTRSSPSQILLSNQFKFLQLMGCSKKPTLYRPLLNSGDHDRHPQCVVLL